MVNILMIAGTGGAKAGGGAMAARPDGATAGGGGMAAA